MRKVTFFVLLFGNFRLVQAESGNSSINESWLDSAWTLAIGEFILLWMIATVLFILYKHRQNHRTTAVDDAVAPNCPMGTPDLQLLQNIQQQLAQVVQPMEQLLQGAPESIEKSRLQPIYKEADKALRGTRQLMKSLRKEDEKAYTKPLKVEGVKSELKELLDNRKMMQTRFDGMQEQIEKLQKIEVVSANEQLMNKVMKVINENISNPKLNVELLSKEVGLSRVHLYRKVKELTDLSVHDFITNLRMKQAETLLQNENLSIADVAYATGFASTAHLSGVFKRIYGCAPSEYRLKTKIL